VALSRPAIGRAALVLLPAAFVVGCAAGPAATPAAETARASRAPERAADARAPDADWESFPRSAEALRIEIDERAAALRTGPIGSRAQQLASLRLAATARELILSGSPDGALAALRKAVSLFGGNGYAYLFLASVHQAEGRRVQAREFAASARRYLPRDEGVQAELDALTRTLGTASTGT
jgi:hypothetical protein